MGKIQTGRFERLSARTYSIKGPGALVDLDETVLGVLQLERQAGMEAHLMQEWETFGRGWNLSASAGNFSWLLISNPAASGRILVVDGFQRGGSNSTSPSAMYMTRGVPPGFNAGPVGQGLDTRIPQGREPAGRLFTFSSNISSFGQFVKEAATPEWQDYQVVLGPDGSIAWRTDAHNQDLLLNIRFGEREAAPFELQ